ncbi:MAG: hypothetical protein J6M24_02560 [Lachnospiraceae bacterium]|nr:hypothetical protein [Lachnospiraceae bacterium]
MDFGAVLKMKGLIDQFQMNHPKVFAFLEDASRTVDEGSVLEMNLVCSDGRKMTTNMLVKESDMELFRCITELKNTNN